MFTMYCQQWICFGVIYSSAISLGFQNILLTDHPCMFSFADSVSLSMLKVLDLFILVLIGNEFVVAIDP